MRAAFAVAALSFLEAMQYSHLSVWAIIVSLGVYLIVAKSLDYLDPFVVFLLPWLLILSLTLLPISRYAKEIHPETYRLTFVAIFSGLVVEGGPMRRRKLEKPGAAQKRLRLRLSSDTWLGILKALFLSLTLLNIVLAGYIPLIQGIRTGETGYTDFGVHGLYGFYLAFSNALALFYLFLYLTIKKKSYLFNYFFILFIFILFVTRQNVLSTSIESLAVYSLAKRRIRWQSIGLFLATLCVFFSILGSFRSGSIKNIAQIDERYQWIPEPLIWIYAYSYFNIANVDKLIMTSGAPYYDGSSLAGLIPSFIRPTYNADLYLEVPMFNVSSYLYPLYQDVGTWGVLLFTLPVMWFSHRRFRQAKTVKRFDYIASYSVLYFCAGFSFFVNFWFYLPVIFQLVFLPFLSRLAEAVASEQRRSAARREIPGIEVGVLP